MGQFNPRPILKTLENIPTRIHIDKQTRQEDTGYEQRVYENNRTPKEEGNEGGRKEEERKKIDQSNSLRITKTRI